MVKLERQEERILNVIAEASRSIGVPSRAIGGYVRDKLLKRDSKDIDIVCEGDGIELAKKVNTLLGKKGEVKIFKRFGTAMIKSGGFILEFVGARTESYNFQSRKPIVESGTFDEDLDRRDFTINTLYIELNEGNFTDIKDKFGGLEDLQKRIIKTPLEPNITFSDDPLRMMRAIRFATQLNFKIDKTTFAAIKNNKDRIKIVSIERIVDELQKIVASPKPSIGFKLLLKSGLLEIIFPEMHKLLGIETKNGISHKDNFYHTIQVLDNICEKSNNIWLRWAAILHDIAKPNTKRFEEKEGWTFHGHEVVGANMVYHIFKRMRLPLDHKMKYVQNLVKLHLRPMTLVKDEVSDSAIRRLMMEAGEDIDDLMTLARADITSKNEYKIKTYLNNYDLVIKKIQEVEEKDKLRNWKNPITGIEIIKYLDLPPSKLVGELKDEIKEAIFEGQIKNSKQEAFKYLLSLATEKELNYKHIQLQEDDTFVVFRLPGESDHYLVRQNDNTINLFDSNFTSKKGFAFCPFDRKLHSPLFIQADELHKNCTFSFESTKINDNKDISKQDYLIKANAFIEATKGDFEKLVLSRTKTLERNEKDIFSIFLELDSKYPDAMIFLVNHPSIGTWMGATPEILLQKKKNKYNTIALAGTQFVEDWEKVRWENKEIKEHATVAKHIEKVLENFNIKFDKNPTYTKVAAKNETGSLVHLAQDFKFNHSGDIYNVICDLHPTPAVSGKPKKEAIQYIRENEGHDREYYTGFLGSVNLLSADSFKFFVNLRSMKVYKNNVVAYVGGGINSQSNDIKEWIETQNKARTIEEVLK